MAVALIRGRLTAADYEDEAAADPRIEQLRALMTVTENPDYTARYRDRELRANPNGIEIVFKDRTTTGLMERDNPVGHPSRRAEGIPLLINKFTYRLERHYPTRRLRRILAAVANQERFLETPVTEFTDLLVP